MMYKWLARRWATVDKLAMTHTWWRTMSGCADDAKVADLPWRWRSWAVNVEAVVHQHGEGDHLVAMVLGVHDRLDTQAVGG